jgi:predicted alpha/beta hydrolase family esterase
MKAHVFIFHGTQGHPGENWFPWLKGKLESLGHKVTVPAFPHPEAPHPKTWYPVMESLLPEINQDSIIIGHSLGCIIALRLLERCSSPVHQTILVAPPLGIPPIKFIEGDSPFIEGGFSWEKIQKNAGRCIVFHSDNDPFISIENGEECARKLGVELTFVPNAGHFNAAAGYTSFPSLLELLKR